jgi:transcriptional regulator with XRE-family HTH domain
MESPDVEPTSVADVADRLRLTRLAMGWSQAELCRRSGISPQIWNNAETGDNRISVDEAIKLCRITGVSLDWIYRGIRVLLPAVVSDALRRVPAGRHGSRRA